jgi:motility quorum-sensing regulator / GCU-specific mRNA interferase toxin
MVAYWGMEKRGPTYDLDAIKTTFGSMDTLATTTSALRDAIGLGFDRAGIVEVIGSMTRKMFMKSMTTFADHRVWQDVYHVPARGILL